MLAYLAQTSLRPCNVVRQMFSWSRHHKTLSHPLPPATKGGEYNWSHPASHLPYPSAQAGTYRLINKHCQCVLWVATRDRGGVAMARVQLGLCHIANSLPLCQGEQLVMGEHEHKKNHLTTLPNNKHTHIPAPFHSTAIKCSCPFPRSPQPPSHTRLGSILRPCLAFFFFLLHLNSSPSLEARVCIRVCVRVHVGVFC